MGSSDTFHSYSSVPVYDRGKRFNYFYMIDGSAWATLGYL